MSATPRVAESITADLRERGLSLWLCQHPITNAGEGRGRADMTRVQVQLAGPGLDGFSPWGYGATVRDAVDDALANPYLRARQPGVLGAMARLEQACNGLALACMWESSGDVPF